MPDKQEASISSRYVDNRIITPGFLLFLIAMVVACVFLATIVAMKSPVQAQPVGGGDRAFSSFQQTGAATITGGTTTGNVAISTAPVAWICNSGTVIAYVRLGTANTVVATVAAGMPIMPSQCVALYATGFTWLAAITASSTAILSIAMGAGHP